MVTAFFLKKINFNKKGSYKIPFYIQKWFLSRHKQLIINQQKEG